MRRACIHGPRGRAVFAKGRSNLNFKCGSLWRFGNSGGARDPETRNRQILERIPAGRWGEAEDIAGAAVYLSSRASDYVNGHVLVVDGGWMAR